MSRFLKEVIERDKNDKKDFDFFILNMANNLKLFTFDMWIVEGRFRILSRVSLLVIFVSSIGFFLEAFHSIWNGTGALTAFFVGCEYELVIFKLGTSILHRKRLFALFDQIRSDFWKFDEKDLRKRKVVVEGSRKMRIVVQLYSGIMFASFVICICRPVFELIIFKQFKSPLLISVSGEKTAKRIFLYLNIGTFGLIKNFTIPQEFQQQTGRFSYLTMFTRPLFSYLEPP